MVELTSEELQRVQVQETIGHLDENSTLNLDALIAQHGVGLTIYVDVERWYDDCEVTIRLQRDRPETDGEYEERIEKLRVRKAKSAQAASKRRKTREARLARKELEERELYETLRRKFGEGGA